MTEPTISELQAELNRQSRELATIRQLLGQVIFAIKDAETEVPEKMRRFMNYMHDVHDVKFMYEELGHPVPQHVNDELQRLDDRYRQLLSEYNAPGGAFEKVRREMAKDPANRWDHTKLLAKPKEKVDETRPSELQDQGADADASSAEGQPDGGGSDREHAGEPRRES